MNNPSLQTLTARLAQATAEQIPAIAHDFLGDGFAVHTDPLGSWIARRNGGGTLMLEAHLDEIRMLVTDYAGGGFLRCAAVGRVDLRTLRAARVSVWGTQRYDAVFGSVPPHLQKNKQEKLPDVTEILLDTGLSEDRIRSCIPLGSTVTFEASAVMLTDDLMTAKALDDRSGCAAILWAAKQIVQQTSELAFTVQLSNLEESGAAAAACGAFAGEIQTCLCVDVSFAKTAGEKDYECGVLGAGPMIGTAPILSNRVTDELLTLAQENHIPFQREIMASATGTNADRIAVTRGGIATGLISVPLRNMHTPVELVSLSDLQHTADLLTVFAGRCV